MHGTHNFGPNNYIRKLPLRSASICKEFENRANGLFFTGTVYIIARKCNFFSLVFYLLFFVFVFFLNTGFFCVSLRVLELILYTELASNPGI